MSTAAGYPARGEQIGPYRVLRRIGGGGMGAVFEAVDESLDRPVALKVIAPHLAADRGFRDRFTAEARALAALDSPHVVPVYAHGDHAGRLYIATRLIPDGDLAQLLAVAGAPPLRVGLDLVGQVASGLADAHATGLVHRDIKPANVLLRRRAGELVAYLADFGVAGRLGADHRPRFAVTVGTPQWMAPELHHGAPAGVASDVYSLGCLLWATLTGHPPYAGTTEEQLAAAHRDQPIPQLLGDSLIVREVNRIVRTALAKDPAARHRGAGELRDELRRAASLPEAVEPPAARSQSNIRAAAALLISAVVGAALLALAPPDDPARRSPATASSDRDRAVASLARTLADRGVLSREEADCTARRWVTRAGLRRMVAAGFFDDDLGFIDRDRRAMTTPIESAATAAARACAG